jgi:hypothetical protein
MTETSLPIDENQVIKQVSHLSPESKQMLLQNLLLSLDKVSELSAETQEHLRGLVQIPRQAETPPTASSAEAEEVRAAARRARRKKGLVIVNTGNGKGKSTAAF